MSPKNNKKIFLGLGLIAAAIGILLTTFYFIEVKPELASRDKAKQKKLNAQKAKVDQRISSMEAQQKLQKDIVQLRSLVRQAEAVYGPEEKNRREGFLWIDRRESKFVVTLGALHGLESGKNLAVYDHGSKVGSVIVETPFDVISYVFPDEAARDALQGDYYRVAIE